MIELSQPKIKADHQLWFLAHYQQGYQALLAQRAPSYELLYLGTALNKAIELSPILLPITTSEQLYTLISDIESNNLKGIFIELPLNISTQSLIELLHQRLFIRYGNNRLGIFHFQNPDVISPFLISSNEKDTQVWLGNILSISWLNTKQQGDAQWHTYHNLEPNSSHTVNENDWRLTASQEQALKLTPAK